MSNFCSLILSTPAWSEGVLRLFRNLITCFMIPLWIILANSDWAYVETGLEVLLKFWLGKAHNLLSVLVSWMCLQGFITWNPSISRRSSVLQCFRSHWDLQLLCQKFFLNYLASWWKSGQKFRTYHTFLTQKKF